MNRQIVLVLLLCCAINAAVAVAAAVAAEAPESPPAQSSQKLKSLLTERRDTLRKLVEAVEQSTRAAMPRWIPCCVRPSSFSKRNSIWRKRKRNGLQSAKDWLLICGSARGCRAGYDRGVARWNRAFEVTAAQLKAEIQLLREQSGETEVSPVEGDDRTLRLQDSNGKAKVELTADREGDRLVLYDDQAKPRGPARHRFEAAWGY